MRIQSRIWVSIAASVAVSAVAGFFAFSILRGMSHDLARGQRYNEVINKAFALNLLIATFKEESGQRDMQQIGDVRRSLSHLLEDMISSDAREESLIRQIRRNNKELGPLLDQFVAQKAAPGSGIETQRKNMLASQLWTKVRFITDDTNRLTEISQSRIVSAQGRAAVVVLALLVTIILIKTTISFVSGRSVVRDVNRLSEGVGHISGGNLAHRIEVSGKNELSDLAQAFNTMAASLQASNDKVREYTQKLERSNQELQDFTFVAAHDLQEPLRKIQTFSDRLRDECRDSLNERGLDFLGRVMNAARRMQSLIEALLQYTRVSMKQEPYQAANLNQVVKEVLEDLSARIAETNGHVVADPLPVIEADPTQMRQLFQNILANALKYHRPGVPPEIRVRNHLHRSGSDEKACAITVSDNGIGFDEQFLEKIFLPFQRLHGPVAYEGTGIGLAICRKIVERHGGTITAKSTPGEGTTFMITLPVKQVSAATREERADGEAVG
jgi:signal transduction histidine kinase